MQRLEGTEQPGGTGDAARNEHDRNAGHAASNRGVTRGYLADEHLSPLAEAAAR